MQIIKPTPLSGEAEWLEGLDGDWNVHSSTEVEYIAKMAPRDNSIDNHLANYSCN